LKYNGADFIIATFHWGNEYQPQPTKRQRELAGICFDEGTDIIVGTHPHIVQPIEISESNGKVKMAAYSLGNFVSFQRTVPRERSVILAVNISKADSGDLTINSISALPIYVKVTGSGKTRVVQIVPAADKIESSILDFLKAPTQKDKLGFYILYKNKD
jgi:poly-gamma-glutamate synthesis protein (capsule biosynthesis protein)